MSNAQEIGTVNFDSSVFLPSYKSLADNKSPYLLIYGSSGSGKSHFVADKLLLHCLEDKYFRCIYGRKVARNIRDSNFKLLKEHIHEYKLSHLFHIRESEMDITCVNGNEFLSHGMDDPEKIKSIVDPTHVWCEELTDYKYEDFQQLDLRLRTPKAEYTQLIGTFNPIDEKHWIKTEIVDKGLNGLFIVHKGYKDNPTLPKSYVEKLEALKFTDPNKYKIYALGEWGKLEVKNPFITAFDERKHLSGKAVFRPGTEIRLSFDFNVDNTVCLFCHSGTEYIHFFDAISAPDLPALLIKIDQKYGQYKYSFKITGDYSGLNRSAMLGGKLNCYVLMMNKLGLKKNHFRLFKNPEHQDSRFLCNSIFGLHKELLIHPSLTDLIYDLKYVECDDNEKIIKKDRSIANQLSDWLDGFRYMINSFHYDFVKRNK